jgi:hypothetical protein
MDDHDAFARSIAVDGDGDIHELDGDGNERRVHEYDHPGWHGADRIDAVLDVHVTGSVVVIGEHPWWASSR